MTQKYLIVRLQEPTLNLASSKSAEFVVGQIVDTKLNEEEAISEIDDILNGPYSEELSTSMPTDIGYAIIPFFTRR